MSSVKPTIKSFKMSDREEKSRKIINHVKLFIFPRILWLHSFSTLYFSPVYHLKEWISSVITICNFGKHKILFTNVGARELRIQDQSCLRWLEIISQGRRTKTFSDFLHNRFSIHREFVSKLLQRKISSNFSILKFFYYSQTYWFLSMKIC